ncbi:MAG: NHL repeat-containing protein [Deltaproteobacteria bacterium]|nr:NHL repeat-containing protein [Deltaproteobacteria bacterium]
MREIHLRGAVRALLAVIFLFLSAASTKAEEPSANYRLKYLFSVDAKTTGYKLRGIIGMYVDETARELYILDGGNRRVVITDTEGTPLYNFRIPQDKDISFACIVVDKLGRIMIAGGKNIALFDYRGDFKGFIDLSSIPDNETLLIQSMDVDSRNHIYIGSGGGDARIIELDENGKFISQIKADGKFMNVNSLSVYNGYTFLDAGNFRIIRLNESGEVVVKFGVLSSLLGGLSMPSGLAVDRLNDRIVVVDTNRMKAILFNRDGRALYEFGGPQMFRWPRAIAVDRQGHIYVGDGSDNVRVFEVVE